MNQYDQRLRFEVYPHQKQLYFENTIKELSQYHDIDIEAINEASFYSVGLEQDQSLESLKNNGPDIFSDIVMEYCFYHNDPQIESIFDYEYICQVNYLPGVTDNIGKSAIEALALVGLNSFVSSGKLFFIKSKGSLEKDQLFQIAKEYFGNPLIQHIEILTKEEFSALNRFQEVPLPLVNIEHNENVEEVNLDITLEEFDKLNVERCLALNHKEFSHIKQHYQDQEHLKIRLEKGLPQWPTDVELEVIAQTWSEHCKHKIFASKIDYREICDGSFKALGDLKVNSLYKTYVKGATKEVEKEYKISWLVSVFSDNAGIVRFDKNIDLCIKAETHNSPSALDPYGGALTGILGVNRDIMGCGLGAKPIANTDVFCFAPSTWPHKGDESLMPDGLMEPMQLLKGVHKGVEDGGNKSGIPTINGAIFFDQDYAGKPLVFCGTVGKLPSKLPDGRETHTKIPNNGDYIVMVGGFIGSDGIHGATFSSLELNEDSPATAVQIGDPITQKRAMDFLLEARDLGLYSSITDNGAGGLSSSVGEMATLTNGARIDLKKCPLKYPGLSPWEIFISESQERMTVAVPPKDWDAFLALSKKRNVESHNLGEFNNSGFLEITLGERTVGHLDLHFLHESLPQMDLKATYDGARERKSWIDKKPTQKLPVKATKEFVESTLLSLLNSENIASKEYWVRQYDHEVQGATHIKPFGGPDLIAPSDSGVILLENHGGGKDKTISVGCGIAPRMSLVDPYLMAQYSVDEAVRNVISTGGDINYLCLLDNFCWPDPVLSPKNPDGDYKLGQLVRTCHGLYDICKAYGLPLVSGKDSMKNDFRGKNRKGDDLVISILPTLLVTAMARGQVGATANSYFQKPGDQVFIIGDLTSSLLGSELSVHYDIEKEEIEYADLQKNRERYVHIFKALQEGMIQSLHDISDGGLICALSESAFGGGLGFSGELDLVDTIKTLFSEGMGRFVLSCDVEKSEQIKKLFAGDIHHLGEVTNSKSIKVSVNQETLVDLSLEDCFKAWNREWIH